MAIGTGQTVYEQIISVDHDNNIVIPATFDTEMYRNGAIYSAMTIDMSLSDASKGVYTASWSASTTGEYQMYAKNDSTNVIFISDNIIVKSDEELSTTIYIGI